MPKVPPHDPVPESDEPEEGVSTPPPWHHRPKNSDPSVSSPAAPPPLADTTELESPQEIPPPAAPTDGAHAPESAPWQPHSPPEPPPLDTSASPPDAMGPSDAPEQPDAPDASQPSAWPELAGVPEAVPAQEEAGAIATSPPVEKRSRSQSLGRGFREIAETVILALLIFLAVRAVVQNFQVEGSSMEPTLHTTQYLLVSKAQYWEINLKTLSKFIPFIDPGEDPTRFIFGGPGRGDVIVFKSPDSLPGQPERDFIKRVIGLPGETVEIHDCTVFIDGEPMDEPYINNRPTGTYGPETVPADYYFVLGDNRTNSRDSRSIGPIPKDNIIGKAWVTYWPFSAFGLVDNTTVEPGGGVSEEPPLEKEGAAAAACS